MIHTSYQSFVESMNEGFFDKAKAAVGLGQLKKLIPFVTDAIASAEKFNYLNFTFQPRTGTVEADTAKWCAQRVDYAKNNELHKITILLKHKDEIIKAFNAEKTRTQDFNEHSLKGAFEELEYMFKDASGKGIVSILVPEHKDSNFYIAAQLAGHDDEARTYTPNGTKKKVLSYLNLILKHLNLK
jgi:hypothetical protein